MSTTLKHSTPWNLLIQAHENRKRLHPETFCLRLFTVAIGLLLYFAVSASPASAAGAILTGRAIMPEGSPMSGAFVYLFDANRSPAESGPAILRQGPDHIVGQLDRHGRFDIEVAPGDYYLAIVKRQSGKIWGPLKKGDLVYQHIDAGGKRLRLSLKAGTEVDLGTLKGHLSAGIADRPGGASGATEIAVLYGALRTESGAPVAGAAVLVYDKPHQAGPPLAVSEPSRADGSYQLPLYQAGIYYLTARSSGPGTEHAGPAKGEEMFMGQYGGSEPQPLVIKPGTVKTGVNITLRPISAMAPDLSNNRIQ